MEVRRKCSLDIVSNLSVKVSLSLHGSGSSMADNVDMHGGRQATKSCRINGRFGGPGLSIGAFGAVDQDGSHPSCAGALSWKRSGSMNLPDSWCSRQSHLSQECRWPWLV